MLHEPLYGVVVAELYSQNYSLKCLMLSGPELPKFHNE